MCVCVREREREREQVCMCVSLVMYTYAVPANQSEPRVAIIEWVPSHHAQGGVGGRGFGVAG